MWQKIVCDKRLKVLKNKSIVTKDKMCKENGYKNEIWHRFIKKKNVKSEEKYIYLTLNEMCQKVNFDDCNTVWKVREKKCNWKKVKPWPNIKYNTWWIVTKDKSENKWNVKKKQQLRETLNLLACSTDTKNGHHGTWLIEWIGQAADSVKSKCDKKKEMC